MNDIVTIGFRSDTSGMAKAERGLNRVERAGAGVDNRLGSMRNNLRYVAGAFAALGVTSLISNITMANSRFEQLGLVMGVVGRNASLSQDQVNKYAKEVEAMGISMTESRQTVIRMTQAQMDLSKASELARLAQDAAVIANTNSSDALGRLIYGLQSGQVEILRTMGLNVNFAASYSKLAAEMGVTADQLSEVDKVQARTNAVMEAGIGIAGAYDASMENAGKQLGSTTRYLQDLGVMWGEVFSDAARDAIFGYSDALKSLHSASKQMSEDGTLARAADALSTAVGALAFVVGTRLTVALGSATIASGKKAAATIAEAKATATASAAEVAFLRTNQASLSAQLANNKSTAAAAGLRAQLAKNTAALTAAQNAHTAALARSTVAARAATAATTAARGALALVGGPAGAAMLAAGAIYYFATRASEAEKIVDRLVPSIDDATQALKNMSTAEQELRAIQAQRELHAVNKQMQDQKKELDALSDGYKEVTRVIQTGMGSALQTVRVPVSTEELLAAQVEMQRTQKAANILSAEIADIEFALDFGTGDPFEVITKSAEAAGEAVATMSAEQIKSLEELAAKYELNTQLIGVTTSREEELIKMRAAGIDVTSAYAQAVLAAADAYDKAADAQERLSKQKTFADTIVGGIDRVASTIKAMENVLAFADELAKKQKTIADSVRAIQHAADPALAALDEYQAGMDTLADGLLNNIIDDQQFLVLADHLLQVRDAALEAAKGMSWLDKMEGGMDALQSGFQQIHSTMDSGSKEAEKLGQAMQALSVVQGIAAILNQGMGDPYTAIGRMAAMAAAVASLIGSVGFAGSGNTAAADAQAAQGTGGVLGDAAAQSESIMKGVDITADATSALVGINRAQLMALQSMQAGITGASGQIMRGQDFSSSSEQWGLYGGQASGVFADSFDFVTSLDGLTGWLDDMLGGYREVINSGIEIAGGMIEDLVNGTVVSAFEDVESKKHFLDSKSTRRFTELLGDEVGGQFALVFGSMVDAVSASAEVLGMTEKQISDAINNFRVAATEISLMDLDGEAQEAAISAVFSDIFDGLALAVVPYVDEFRAAGEAYAETLVRIATQVQVAEEAMSQLGMSLLDGLAGLELAQLSDDLIKAAGGMEQFITGFTGFVDKFATESHKLEIATASITSGLEQAGFTDAQMAQAMSGGDGLWALMQTLTDPAQIATLFRLQDSFSEFFSAIDKEASQAFDLNIQLLRLQGKEEEALALIRENALEGMSESNRALQEQIWTLQDLEAAAEAATQAQQALADFQRGIADQILDIISPAHAELERLNRAMGAQIEQAEALGLAEEDLINMRHLHQLQLLQFAAGLEESISSMSDELFGTVDNGMDKTVNSVGEGMNRIRESMIRAIDGVNKWLDSSMLSSVSPLTPEDRLGEAERQFNLQFAGAMGGDTDAMAALPKLADQLLSEASGFFGGSTQEFDQIWMQVRDAMEQVSGLSIPDAQDPQRAIQQATESTAMSALQQITLASDMIGQIAALARVTGETPADIADRLGVPIGGLLDILESTPGEFAGAMDENFNDLVTGFDMTIDPLLSVQNAQLEETRQMRTEQNERLDRIEQALLDGVNYQRATAVNTGETANQQGQAVAIQRRNENKPSGAGRINV